MIDYDPASDTGKAPSPCINICKMNPQTGLCEGCFRTRDEIAAWSQAGDTGKRGIWDLIEQRIAALQGRPGS